MKTKSCNVVGVKLYIVFPITYGIVTTDNGLCQTQQYCSILLTTSPHNIIASCFRQPEPTNNFCPGSTTLIP